MNRLEVEDQLRRLVRYAAPRLAISTRSHLEQDGDLLFVTFEFCQGQERNRPWALGLLRCDVDRMQCRRVNYLRGIAVSVARELERLASQQV